ncbi:MAG TPA: hypothetical protein VG871_06790, partial [Vicinamibacterales bacterium]|nr:hypothetical protein [Vicinamibacterales bacterium]
MERSREDPDRLAAELNDALNRTGRSVEEPPARDHGPLLAWLSRVREEDGSDLLLVAGAPPTIRAHGRLLRASTEFLDGADIFAAVDAVLPARLRTRYAAGEAVDVAFQVPGLGRFRMNLHRERERCAAAIRALPLSIPPL